MTITAPQVPETLELEEAKTEEQMGNDQQKEDIVYNEEENMRTIEEP
jgi:hypothetical protein